MLRPRSFRAARPLLLRSHALPSDSEGLGWASSDDESSSGWGSDDGASDTAAGGLTGGLITPTASDSSSSSSSSRGSSEFDKSGGIGGEMSSSGSGGGVETGSGGAIAPPQPPRPLVCEFKEVSARLKGSATAQVDLEAKYTVDPQLLFSLLADPHQHDRIFEAIESADAALLSEDGPVRTYRLDYVARWQFWKVAGKCTNKLIMTTDSAHGTVSFRLREPGFLRGYEGCWTITGPSGMLNPPATTTHAAPPPTHAAARPAAVASLSLMNGGGGGGGVAEERAGAPQGVVAAIAKMLQHQAAAGEAAAAAAALHPRGGGLGATRGAPARAAVAIIRAQCFTTPARTPPPPINQALKSQARSQLEGMLEGLLAAAERVQHEQHQQQHHSPAGRHGGGFGGRRLAVEELRVDEQ